MFALGESRRTRDEGILAGMPDRPGIGDRLKRFLVTHRADPGAAFALGHDPEGNVFMLEERNG